MSDEPIRLTYTGNPAFVGALVQLLEDEGLDVDWEPPREYRSANIPEDVLVGLLVSGLSDTIKVAIRIAVRRFRERFARRGGEVRSDDLDLDNDDED